MNEGGVILTLTLIFMIVLTIIAGISVVYMINQARVSELQIKRIRSFYTAESAVIKAFDELRLNGFGGSPSAWTATLTLNSYTATVITAGSHPLYPLSSYKVQSKVEY